jgi:hypothetical protein
MKIVNYNKSPHHLWQNSSAVVDIAILKLNRAFEINQFVIVIPLATRGYQPPGVGSML